MRKYINLIEATLFRGDAREIETYDIDKTANGLFGYGIYLTDNKDVAGDYTVSSTKDMITNPREKYKSQRDAIAGVIMDILNKELDWPSQQKDIIDARSREWWDNDETRSLRFNDPAFEEAQERVREKYNTILMDAYKAALRKAKALYKQRAVDYRIVKDTMNRWMIVKADRTGIVSRFDIPDEYLARTMHGDEPMSDAEIKIVGTFIEKVHPHGSDFRDRENGFVRTDDGSHNFWKWVEIFKKHGSEYAWRDGRDRLMGGKGENPSLDQVWNGQHGGFNVFNQAGKEFIPFMQAHGYTGIRYHGGLRIGDHVRGGGGIRHTSYVLWDSDFVNKCRVDHERVQDTKLNYDPSKLSSKSLYTKHKFPE